MGGGGLSYGGSGGGLQMPPDLLHSPDIGKAVDAIADGAAPAAEEGATAVATEGAAVVATETATEGATLGAAVLTEAEGGAVTGPVGWVIGGVAVLGTLGYFGYKHFFGSGAAKAAEKHAQAQGATTSSGTAQCTAGAPPAGGGGDGDDPKKKKIDWNRTGNDGQSIRDHVNDHATDNPLKPKQGVFTDDPVSTTEEAWTKIQNGQVQPGTPGGNGNIPYDVPMGRSVGYQGGYNGNGMPLNSVRVIMNPAGQLVTAYPY